MHIQRFCEEKNLPVGGSQFTKVGAGLSDHGVWPGVFWRILASLGLLAGMTGLYFLSELSDLPQPPLIFPGLDKLEHAVAYGILSALAYLALGVRHRGGRPLVSTMLFAVFIVTLYAVFDELHQAHVPGRDASFYDGLADLGGAILGVVLVWKVRRRGIARINNGG